ncbi:MAG: hypothetical protein A2X94_06995 [Bdellovibrionales bacterium GWB1_55_8]|nr:MAG: hypothetical protein A2X94_06995 [Bdellovibrionales bacterium GWB1_55_8]
MAKKALVIVESPSKAKTIQKYLGREYIVKASVGHIKDLPKSKLGVDPDKGFEPDYQLIPTKTKVMAELKKASESVPLLYLATDPDREGEAIAWHINEELKARGKKVHRVLFNAITKPAILEAIANPQKLNADLYRAQQARRVLDRLVGYKISPLLWDKVKRGISAGRVQSVALRLVVDREAEIKAFKPEEYWKLEGSFSKDGAEFKANLFKINGKDPELPNKAVMDDLLEGVKKANWAIHSIEQKERSRKPAAPFITSRLQQDASRKLGFSAKKTMTLAQRLYEGVDLGDMGTHGLITYMRTDSVRIEPGALQSVREFILQQYGKQYLPAEPNVYKSRKSAQEAHEAIRPTSLEFEPAKVQPHLEKDEFRLYQLIWNRFVASQMTPAIYDQTAIDIMAKDKSGREIQFRMTGSVMRFAGFSVVYLEAAEEGDKSDEEALNELKLPPLKEGDHVSPVSMNPTQHFTQPPPRYTDASLIRDLEEKGIGRPSTYATILSNLQDREYVEKREARYYPSELGTVVTDLLVASFPDILNAEFTAGMEDQLDDIEAGRAEYKKTLSTFWKPFKKTLEAAKKHMKDVKRQEVPTDIQCEKCSHTMMIKWGKLGSFLACSHYPECKNTQDFKKDDQGKIVIIPKEYTDKKCEKCSNPMIVKSGKFGKFLACSDYPNCKFTQAITLGIPCPECKIGELTQKQSRYRRIFYSCNRWPDCSFALWDKPIEKPCPQCGFALLTEKITKRAGLMHKCPKKECGYIDIIDPNAGKAPASEPDEEKAASA